MDESLMWCPLCSTETAVPFDDYFGHLMEDFPCSACGKSVHLAYESLYDEETQDADGWFCLEAAYA